MPPDPPVSRQNLIIGRALAILMVAFALGVVAILALRLTAWRGVSKTVPADTGLAEQCADLDATTLAAARRTTIAAADGFTLGAAETGSATAKTVVILRHGASQTICDWLPWAAQTSADTGARVLLFDRRGRGSSPGTPSLTKEPADLVAAATKERAAGASEVVLVASSMGNSVVYAALPDLSPQPCAVVSISPVLLSGDSTGEVRGDALKKVVPNTWVAWETKNPPIVRDANAVIDAVDAAGGEAQTLDVETADHSRQLLSKHPEVATFVREGIASCH